MATHHLDDTQTHAFWDNSHPARLRIQSGDTVVFETLEASARQVTPESPSEVVGKLDFAFIHPLTGPVADRAAGLPGWSRRAGRSRGRTGWRSPAPPPAPGRPGPCRSPGARCVTTALWWPPPRATSRRWRGAVPAAPSRRAATPCRRRGREAPSAACASSRSASRDARGIRSRCGRRGPSGGPRTASPGATGARPRGARR